MQNDKNDRMWQNVDIQTKEYAYSAKLYEISILDMIQQNWENFDIQSDAL